jgi:predicted TIM-barrel fold metal-dependent hydrolase
MSRAAVTEAPNVHEPKRATGVIDVDVHEYYRQITDLLPYLEGKWHRFLTEYKWPGVASSWPYVVPTVGGSNRADARPISGGPPGSDLDTVRSQLLDAHGITHAVLTGNFHVASMEAWFDLATALASAYNDWLIENWLERDPRLLGSIQVAVQDPAAAAREIDRVASHPRMVQVFLPMIVGPRAGYGDPQYRPIFEAASRNNLVVALHHGRMTKTLFGYPNHFIEWHQAVPHAGMCHAASLICSGVLEQFPNLKVVILETGYTWLAHFMWRMDQQYKGLRVEVPWVKRLPSEYMHDQVRVSTQPAEEISTKHFLQFIDMIGSENMLLFSTDYPHFDFDSPVRSLPAGLPEALKRKILSGNAAAVYGIEE